jgi:Fe-S cluster assembly iron-binding protein IscA
VDAKTDTDESFVFGDLEVIIDEALIKYCEKINIEYVLQKGGGCSSGGGFRLTPKNKI